jgi:hypothetical protein
MSERADANAVQSEQHAGGRTPDGVRAVGNVAKFHFLARECRAAPLPAVCGRIEDVAERHFEGVLHLLGIEQQLEARLHERDHRRHQEAGDHQMIRQVTDHGHEALVEPDLLARFAQRRGTRAAVTWLDAAAGKGHLPGVSAQLGGALREQHRDLGSLDQRHQHRRGHRVLREELAVLGAGRLPQAGYQPVRQRVARLRAGEPRAHDLRPVLPRARRAPDARASFRHRGASGLSRRRRCCRL